nr:hypothetical protein [Tanacetum cinerariifolium]
AIHVDLFPFSAGPYYATYPQDGVAGNCEFTREFPTPGEMVRVEALSEDQLTAKITDSRLKGYEENVAGAAGLELQVSTLKKQVSGLNDKLASFDASFAKSNTKGKERKKKDQVPYQKVQGELLSLAASAGFERGLSMHRTKDEFATVLKKMANFIPGAQDRLAETSLLVARTDYAFLNKISEHATEPLSESNVTPASKSLELYANVDLMASAVASEHNEEMGISIVLEDAVELAEVGSGRASSGPNDVVVALFVGEKGDGLVPSSAGEGRVVCRRTLVASSLGKTDCRYVVVHPMDPESCHPP